MIDDRTIFLEWLCTEHSAGIMKDQQERLADGLQTACTSPWNASA